MRKQSFFQPAQENQGKLQPLRRMQTHQSDLRPLIVVIRIGDQRRMIQKLVEGLATILRIHRRIHQFTQVLDPRISLRRILPLKDLDVSSPVNQKLQNVRSADDRCRE